MADRANHSTAAFFTTWMLAWLWSNMRELGAAITRFRRELATERSRQNLEQREILTASLLVTLVHLGNLEAARALEPEVSAGAGWPAQAWLAYAAGDWERAASIAVEECRRATVRGDNGTAWSGQWILGRARTAQGDLAGCPSCHRARN